MPDELQPRDANDERLTILRKRISRCRKVLAKLHDNYLEEMRQVQAQKESNRSLRRAGYTRVG
jgi:GTP1/Obg family GTP-binding protein